MYPRLVLARELLSDDGVIFISIDDNELANLKLICDEIFGEENMEGVNHLIVKTEGRRYGSFAKSHESFLVYSKNIDFSALNEISIPGKNFDFNDELGGFNIQDLRNQNARAFNSSNRPNLRYPFYINPDEETSSDFLTVSLEKSNLYNQEVFPITTNNIESVWRWGKIKSNNEIYNLCARKSSEGYRIFQKKRKLTETPKTIWIDKNFLSNKGTKEVSDILGSSIFDFPKPLEFLYKILEIGTMNNSLILDFFSGSATTAHAVMKLNAEDGGNRKYILVQLPEEIEESKPAFKAGYKTIDEIGRERIKRAAQKIKEETNADIDYGFKVVKLENVQEDTLDRLESFDPNVLVSDDYVNDFSNEDSSGLETILTTWLNQDGYGLHAKWEDFKLVNYIAHRYSNSFYIVNEGIESSDISRLIEMIENNELNISRIVIYTYSLPFTIINELKTNIKNLRNNKTVDIIERY